MPGCDEVGGAWACIRTRPCFQSMLWKRKRKRKAKEIKTPCGTTSWAPILNSACFSFIFRQAPELWQVPFLWVSAVLVISMATTGAHLLHHTAASLGSILKSPWCQTGHAMCTGGTRPCLGESSSWLKPCSNHHIIRANEITRNTICLHGFQECYLVFVFHVLRVFAGQKQRATGITILRKGLILKSLVVQRCG